MGKKRIAAILVTDWRERDGVQVRFNGDKNAWEVKVNGKILKACFRGEQAAVRFGLVQLCK